MFLAESKKYSTASNYSTRVFPPFIIHTKTLNMETGFIFSALNGCATMPSSSRAGKQR